MWMKLRMKICRVQFAGSNIAAFGSRAAKQLARFILRRLHESSRVRAAEATMQQVYALQD